MSEEAGRTTENISKNPFALHIFFPVLGIKPEKCLMRREEGKKKRGSVSVPSAGVERVANFRV
jgi:hypothetical protein